MSLFVFVGQPEYQVERRDEDGEVLSVETRGGDPAPKEVNIWRYERDGKSLKIVFVRGEPTEVSDADLAAKIRRHSHFKEVLPVLEPAPQLAPVGPVESAPQSTV
jgi:hypothetical protein